MVKLPFLEAKLYTPCSLYSNLKLRAILKRDKELASLSKTAHLLNT